MESAKPPSGAGGNDAIASARVSMAFISQLIHKPGPCPIHETISRPAVVFRHMWRIGIAWLAALAVATGNLAEKPHPRLWFTRDMETPLREKLAADPLAARLHEAAMKEATTSAQGAHLQV